MLPRLSSLFKGVIEDAKRFREAVMMIVIISGLILWFLRIIALLGLLNEPRILTHYSGEFGDYYEAAKKFLENKAFYGGGFLYPPPAVLLFIPMALLSFNVASVAFLIFKVFILAATLTLVFKFLAHHGIILHRKEKLLLMVSSYLFYPVSLDLIAGNVNIILVFLIVVFYYFIFIRRNSLIASLSLVLASIMKIWPFILTFISFLHPRARDVLPKSVVILALILLITFPIFGTSTYVMFIETLLNFQRGPEAITRESILGTTDPLEENNSVFMMIYKVGVLVGLPNHVLTAFTMLLRFIIIFLTSVYLYLGSRSNSSTSNTWGLLALNLITSTIFIISNVTWQHYFVLLLPMMISYLFIFKGSIVERILLLLIIFLVSFKQFLISVLRLAGGSLVFIVYLVPPITVAYILYFILALYTINKYHVNIRRSLGYCSILTGLRPKARDDVNFISMHP